MNSPETVETDAADAPENTAANVAALEEILKAGDAPQGVEIPEALIEFTRQEIERNFLRDTGLTVREWVRRRVDSHYRKEIEDIRASRRTQDHEVQTVRNVAMLEALGQIRVHVRGEINRFRTKKDEAEGPALEEQTVIDALAGVEAFILKRMDKVRGNG
jgi:hypothetical protein